MRKHKALFLDRDGVINIDTTHAYRREDIIFTDGLFDVCRRAHAHDYKIIVVTNQAGIARGLYDETQFYALMRWMGERFMQEGCAWTDYYFCPHHPDITGPCDCRKPKPGMILRAIADWNIDPSASLLIGDNQTDLEAGKAAGVGRLELFKGQWPRF